MNETTEHSIPKRSTPTWEMELLISGATTVGLLQLPAVFDRWAMRGLLENETELAQFQLTLILYAQFAVLVLIATFVAHLLLRAYWVGLVGLFSVYPDGVRWQNFRSMGPINRSQNARRLDDFGAVIEAADNRATKVFGLGLGLAMSMLWPVGIVGSGTLALFVAQRAGWPLQPIATGFWVLLAIAAVPQIVAMQLDRSYGSAWLGTRKAVWLERILACYGKLGVARASNPLLTLVQSQHNSRWATAMMVLVVVMILNAIAFSLVVRLGDWDSGAFDGLPARQAKSSFDLTDAHYADRRDLDGSMMSPFIPSLVARGDYLPLFLPYRPREMNAVLARECPSSLTDESANEGRALACIGRLLETKLDGQPIALTWFGARDPASAQRGALAMVPIQDLKPGMHRLKLKRLMRKVDPENDWHDIEFWR